MDNLMSYAHPLEHRLSCMCQALLNTSASPSTTANTSVKTSASNSNLSTSRPTCTLCTEVHRLIRCSIFLKYDVARKRKYLKSKNGCSNDLSLNHNSQCPSSYNCKKCYGRHHTLLHIDDAPLNAQPSAPYMMVTPSVIKTSTLDREDPPKISFRHTTMAQAVHGERDCTARVALDTGSSSSLIKKALTSQLRIKRYHQRLIKSVLSLW